MIQLLISNKKIRTALLVIMALLACVSLLQGVRNAVRDSQDFQWDAMKVFSMRINPYDESDSMNPSGILDEYGYDEYYLQMEANQFPSLLMLLLPFAPLKPLTARYVWIVCNLVFTFLIILLLRKTFLKDLDGYWFSIISLLMIAGTPYRNQMGVGQHTLFAFCLFLVAVYYSEYCEKRNAIVTTLALFVCYFKYTLTVPLVLYFVYKKRYKEVIISAFMHVILTGVSAWWLSDSFLNMIIKPLKVSSNLAAEGGLDISALLKGSPISYFLALIIMVVLLAMAVKLPEGCDRSYISVLALWSLIITYHRTYDFFVMIVAVALFLEMKELDKLKIYYIVTTLAVFFVLRLFHEADLSKIVVGAMYYALTFVVTYKVMRLIWTRKAS
ncbi:MAG: glycosyltransferase family 87 protein [Lachnospiraceae bacterium]|nr:glycosyltransferase family 87 protein [Lachnospiraceae bacterium]